MRISSTAFRASRILGLLAAAAGFGLLVFHMTPSVYGQRADGPDKLGAADRAVRELTVLSGRGAEIGVSIRDTEPSDRQTSGGVIVEDVRPDSPAEKAGVRRSDLIVEFDGERVRSARQFSRLVQETPSGRAVKATIIRDGQKRDVQITPSASAGLDRLWQNSDRLWPHSDRLREHLDDLGRLSPGFQFDFNLDRGAWELLNSRGRLGVTVSELTPQLANYFGAKDGVLVATVTDDSPAARAGLRAGDVITTINGERVRSHEDLVRALGDVKDGGEVTIGIVRDKRESTLTAKIESRRPSRSGRPA